jgi:hypothetical protein
MAPGRRKWHRRADADWGLAPCAAALEQALHAAVVQVQQVEVVRSTLIRAARVWREDGEPWLTVPPLIEMLDERAQKREPYPITWAEQSKLLQRLPATSRGASTP